MASYSEPDAAMKAADWRFDPDGEAFYDRNDIPLDYGELMALVPGTTEDEFAAWAEAKGARIRAARSRCGASLLELLISLSIVGGLAGLILTAAMMVLNRAMHILD